MKIAALSNISLDPTLGSGKTRLAWSRGLRDLGHEVNVFPPETYYKAWPDDKGRRIKMRLDALSLKKQLLAGNYDLIEFYGAEFGPLIDSLARLPRVQRPLLVAHTDGLELLMRAALDALGESSRPADLWQWMGGLIDPTIAKWDVKAFSRVDAFVSPCQADVDYLTGHGFQPADRCAVVEYGLDEFYLRAPWQRPKQNSLVSLGSWIDRKDPVTTVKVASDLLAQNPRLEFHILGGEHARDHILSEFTTSVRSRIIIHPHQPNLVEVLSQAKVLLFPSLYEGFGLATAEAMACGCAVVVTPTGFGASIRDGVDGFVCDFRDADTMRAHCQALLNNEELRQRISSAGRERVKEMTWQRQIHALESIYKHWVQTL